jgi:hypothetical protein
MDLNHFGSHSRKPIGYFHLISARLDQVLYYGSKRWRAIPVPGIALRKLRITYIEPQLSPKQLPNFPCAPAFCVSLLRTRRARERPENTWDACNMFP